ncbi:MAG: M3 family metallopeptidase [Myxococcota bacterium]
MNKTGNQPAEQVHALQQECERHLGAVQRLLQKIVSVTESRNQANTLLPYNDMLMHLDAILGKTSLLDNVHPQQAVREQAQACEQQAKKLATQLSLNRELYDALAAVPAEPLDALAKRMLKKTLQDFQRSGVDRDDATRARIAQLNDEITKLEQTFEQNIRQDSRHITLLSVDELDGLPQDYIQARQPTAEGHIRISTDYPDFIPFMAYAKSAKRRRELWFAFVRRGHPHNAPVLQDLFAKRHRLADLLGFSSYAAYATGNKMAKNPQNVQQFIEQMAQLAAALSRKEYDALLGQKRQHDPQAQTVHSFERSHLQQQVQQEQFSFRSQQMRPYFPFKQVQQGLLELSGELFGVRYEPVTPGADVWHPSVQVYDVYQHDGTKPIGRISLDLHPREGKYKHAAQFSLVSGLKDRQLPHGVLVCNFPQPSDDNPALMEPGDVETFFHEFGHLLHHIFGGQQQPWMRFSGVATEWDFVEAPSQLLEEWVMEPQVLQRFAHHYETGEVIPTQLIERFRRSQEFGKGLDVRQQMFYAALSLQLHQQDLAAAKTDLLTVLQQLQKRYSPFAYVPDTYFHLSFGHLGGYSALYYTYMWSKAIAKDLFTLFQQGGLLNTHVAQRYRDTVLAPGGSKDAAQLVQDFLGRPWQLDAFKKWLQSGSEKT